MKSENIFKVFINRKLYRPRGLYVIIGIFAAFLAFSSDRESQMKNTILVNTESLIPVCSYDTLPVLSANGDSIGFVNPFFIFYLDSMSNIKQPGPGSIYAWIWNESINVNAGTVVLHTDENIRVRNNAAKLGRLSKGSEADLIYQDQKYHWSLIKTRIRFAVEPGLTQLSFKDLKHRRFRRPFLYTTDFTLLGSHEIPIRSLSIDIGPIFNAKSIVWDIIIYFIFFLILMYFIIRSYIKKESIFVWFIIYTYSFTVGASFFYLIKWIFRLIISHFFPESGLYA